MIRDPHATPAEDAALSSERPSVWRYIREIRSRRDLMFHLVAANLKAEHRNSVLGYLWWLLDPLLGLTIYYYVVGVLFGRGGQDYGAYLIVGLVAWRWFSASIGAASRSIVSRAGLISQVYLPKAILPATTAITGLVNFTFGLGVIALFLGVWGIVPGTALVWLPFVMLVQVLFTLAIALAVAYLCVWVRDTDTLLGHVMYLWFFATPVIWRPEMLPPRHAWLIDVNPMAAVVQAYRSVLLYDMRPPIAPLALLGLVSAVCVAGLVAFYSAREHHIVKAL